MAFATEVAARLPGWRPMAPYHRLVPYLAASAADTVWDDSSLLTAMRQHPVSDVAMLAGTVGDERMQLLVLPRPARRGYLVGAMLNWATPHPDPTSDIWAHVPRAVAVPADPARAASSLSDRLLPRITQCLWSVRTEAVDRAVRLIRTASASWDAVSDSFCDAAGYPLDDQAYGQGLVARDAQAWDGFAGYLVHGPAVLARVEADLRGAGSESSAGDRWRVSELRHALTEGLRLQSEWLTGSEQGRLSGAGPARLADLEAERNEEAWHAMTIVAEHGAGLGEFTERLAALGSEVRPGSRSVMPRPISNPRSQPAAARTPPGLPVTRGRRR
ncbi:hypothetical protein [Streptacidiphilus neutrinimicus]|uniref:hypothetical protein n=1 Tax=Streptacidiphilus neutrinimicus TaxID=105420 RepID=UPI00126A4EA2|nr:hypothetical protein [Streptacidiphilus neutrinimicus]